MFCLIKRIFYNTKLNKDPDFCFKIIAEFERFLRVEKGLGEITVAGYLKAVKRFIKITKKAFPKKKEVEEYIFGFYKDKKSWSHIRNTAKALEWWMEFLGHRVKLGRAKKPKKIVRQYLTEEEVNKLIEACQTLREKAIITLLAYTGIRTKEICNVKISDVNTKENLVLIREGKLFKDRVIHITKECSDLLKEYIKAEGRKTSDWLFINLTNGRQITTSRMREIVREIASRTDLKKRVYPYIFRHSLATNLLNNGSNILAIKNQLGHANLETTLVYLESDPKLYRESYLRFCPNYLDSKNIIIENKSLKFISADRKNLRIKQMGLKFED